MGHSTSELASPQSGTWRVAIAVTFLAFANAASSIAGNATETTANQDTALYLEVFVNGGPKGLIAEFVQENTGRFRSTGSELRAIGVDPGSSRKDTDWVYLDDLPDVGFTYDQALQTIQFSLQPEGMALSAFDLRGAVDPVPLITPSAGGMLNYVASGRIATDPSKWDTRNNAASLLLDAHLFSPMGSVNQSGLIATQNSSDVVGFRRLETSWSKSDPSTQRTYIAGDLITGGASWARPIRIGGFSVRRNFATRPDLITRPLPNFAGTAQVPSTIDVFLGDLRMSSIDVDAGPFAISNIPVPDANGDLRFVVRDSTGVAREETLSFAGGKSQLRKGLVDFSIDAGFARTGYGSEADVYGNAPVGVGNLRYGLTDRLTVELQAEAGAGLASIGAGVSASLPGIGVVRLAGVGSAVGSLRGTLLSAGYSYSGQHFAIDVETRRTIGNYRDLADVTAVEIFDSANIDRYVALDRALLSSRLFDGAASYSVGYTHSENAGGEHRHIVNASLGYQVNPGTRVWLDGFTDLGAGSHMGVYAGLTMTLGDNRNLSTGARYDKGGFSLESSISKSAEQEPGSWGYAASLGKTRDGPRLYAGASHYGERASTVGSVRSSRDSIALEGSVEGSVALLNGEVELLNRIDDSFLVVDAGSPGVRVYRENQLVGRTGKNGKLFVGGVRAYEANKISIEPTDLPLDSQISQAGIRVSLPEKSGATVRLSGVDKDSPSGIVVFVDGKGAFLPAGSTGKHSPSGTEFVVGYDGEALLEEIRPENHVEITVGTVLCIASFVSPESARKAATIGPVTCSTQ